ncbi:MAG: hypothetical protein HY540_04180 [Deltaproteobacteria bacterium]|nr:hypothetical protein [Deltaproteobacteria bacterium]
MFAVLASGAINLFPDKTFFIQWAIFLFVVVIVQKYLLGPSLRIIQRRREEIEGGSREAEAIRNQATTLEADIDNRLQEERQNLFLSEELKRKKAEDEAKSMLDDMRKRMAHEREANEGKLKILEDNIGKDLEQDIPQYTKMILERLMDNHQEGGRA